MPKRTLPVYDIDTFHHLEHGSGFYANTFSSHLREHHFVNTPHKHDFYLLILFTSGKGRHHVDFNSYPVKPGALFILSPGQTHSWELSDDTDGYVFFHTRDFYDLYYTSEKVQEYPFFRSIDHRPLMQLKPLQLAPVEAIFRTLLDEYQSNRAMRLQKIRSLINICYVELSRLYLPAQPALGASQSYLDKVRKLEALLEQHYKTVKSPKAYAALMNMSERHLNRICRLCLKKNISGLIADRVMLEARRMLVQARLPVAEVAAGLGYFDQSYFTRLFKKRCGYTPTAFTSRYR